MADSFHESPLIEKIAAVLSPRYRVLSLSLRASVPYQVWATDLVGMLDQFGFTEPALVGEGLGCLPALLVAAWYPMRVRRMVLVEPTTEPPGDTIEARGLRDCPPDWPRLRAAVRCPMLETTQLYDIEAFLAAPLP